MGKPKGYSRYRNGFRAWKTVGDEKRYKTFARDEEHLIKGWRVETEAQLRKLAPDTPRAGSISAELPRYRDLVKAMPTLEQRMEHLDLWADALGRTTPLSDITPEPIRAILQGWKAAGLAAATCNKRRTALMHLFTTLLGKDARNPVRAVKKFRVDDPLPRGRDPHVIDAKLLKAPRCRSRACARVMLWTGMRPAELERAEPDDVDLKHRTVIVRTAKGGRTRVVPLTAQGVSAWREFEDEDCWHRVPQSAPFNRLVKKWTGVKDLRVYDCRHSYGTQLARKNTRLDVIGALMGHSTLDLTRRYTLAAVAPEALEATARLGKKLHRKVAHRKRTKKHKGKAA